MTVDIKIWKVAYDEFNVHISTGDRPGQDTDFYTLKEAAAFVGKEVQKFVQEGRDINIMLEGRRL